jgi:hypothetical protein
MEWCHIFFRAVESIISSHSSLFPILYRHVNVTSQISPIQWSHGPFADLWHGLLSWVNPVALRVATSTSPRVHFLSSTCSIKKCEEKAENILCVTPLVLWLFESSCLTLLMSWGYRSVLMKWPEHPCCSNRFDRRRARLSIDFLIFSKNHEFGDSSAMCKQVYTSELEYCSLYFCWNRYRLFASVLCQWRKYNLCNCKSRVRVPPVGKYLPDDKEYR